MMSGRTGTRVLRAFVCTAAATLLSSAIAVAYSVEPMSRGQNLHGVHCASCHGASLQGAAPAGRSTRGTCGAGDTRRSTRSAGKDGIVTALDRDSHEVPCRTAISTRFKEEAPITVDGTHYCPGTLGASSGTVPPGIRRQDC